MKKLIFITSFVIIFSLCACSSDDNSANQTANSQTLSTTNNVGNDTSPEENTAQKNTSEETQDPKVLKFAEELRSYIKNKDLESFSKVCTYPLYVASENTSIKKETDLVSLGADKVFSENLNKSIEYSKNVVITDYAGYRIGSNNFNIWIDNSCKVTGINN